ncbi:unnamed protein product [Durusdinium trenchii]|uniref:Uncharacterized protein n=1 Tax=Durusdinium trenchii TaxID=1381693 RepID=A0ABP0HK17_9DINO
MDRSTSRIWQLGELLWSLSGRLDGSAQQAEWPFLRDILLWLYEKFPTRRAQLRGVIGRQRERHGGGKPLKSAGRFVHKSAPLAPLLQVLGPIIRGFQTPLGGGLACRDKLRLLVLEKEPRLSGRSVEALCGYLPQSHESNTPKEVLVIHELAEIMKVMQPEDLKGCMQGSQERVDNAHQRHMVRLFTSQNAQTLQSVLQLWKDGEDLVEGC